MSTLGELAALERPALVRLVWQLEERLASAERHIEALYVRAAVAHVESDDTGDDGADLGEAIRFLPEAARARCNAAVEASMTARGEE